MKRYIPVLSIAGSDPSGGAGIQADIKTISSIGCYAMAAITSLTAQNTTGVSMVSAVDPAMVGEQIRMVFNDIRPLAVKTGMLANASVAECVASCLEQFEATSIVVDPVMVSTSGALLLEHEAIETVKRRLFPLATIVTPNLREAVELTSQTDPMKQACVLREMGCRNILLKGGDTADTDYKTDLLLLEDEDEFITLRADAVDTRNTHGTGCTLSSAIATYLALEMGVEEAVTRAKIYITRALNAGARVTTGRGHGPVNHLYAPRHAKYIMTKHKSRL